MSGRKKVEDYKIEFINYLLDNVYGFIGLTEVENEIEQLPVFKRLKNISQLGLTSRIFPCAVHDRYVHSLGVMHVVDQMALHLGFDDDERQILRLAGLLHDIGHYPLSHDVEGAYIMSNSVQCNNNDINTIFNDTMSSIRKSICSEAPKMPKKLMQGTQNKFHHEKIGELVIKNSSKIKEIINNKYIQSSKKYRNKENALEEVVNVICAIITGNGNYVSELFSEKFGAMVQLMHSELDADRIDYLLRDATFSGASYGSFDLSLLLQNLKMKMVSRTLDGGETKNEYIVGVTPKGIGSAEQFLINRYLAYSQVIYHKYTSVLGLALKNIVIWLNLTSKNTKYDMSDIEDIVKNHENNDKFYSFTDKYLLKLFDDCAKNKDDWNCPDFIYKLIESIREFRALNMQDEVVFSSINNNKICDDLMKSDFYKSMKDIQDTNKTVDSIFQYNELKLTKHVPIEIFENNYNIYLNKCAPDKHDTVDIESYKIDRLQEGIAVIEDDKEPYLLVDSKRSMLRDIYGLKFVAIRKYKI